MQTIKFIGDPNTDPPGHGPETINFFGMALPKGKAVACSDARILAKAESSNHFTVKDVKHRKGTAHDENGE